MKDRVFATSTVIVKELKTRIQATKSIVTGSILKKTQRELKYNLDIFRAFKGTHAKIYWVNGLTKNL